MLFESDFQQSKKFWEKGGILRKANPTLTHTKRLNQKEIEKGKKEKEKEKKVGREKEAEAQEAAQESPPGSSD